MGSKAVGTVEAMTTREKFDRLVDRLSALSLKAEYARLLREREIDRQVTESYERTPQFEPDGWVDLEKAFRAAVLAVTLVAGSVERPSTQVAECAETELID